MRRLWAVCRKELLCTFASPVFYIVAAVNLILFGVFFYVIVSASREAHLRYVFHNISVVLLFTSPMLTMRLFAEERKLGTFELLMTSPLTLLELVLGKLLGAALTFAILLALTVDFPILLLSFGRPDWGPLLTGYLGLFLMGLAFLAAGMFASSLTDNQVVAVVIGFGIALLLFIISWFSPQVGGPVGDFLEGMSISGRFENFARGVLDTGDVIFCLSLTGIFTFLTVRSLDWRRW
ncbi:MAG: ABC transporter permease [Candidatus Coatesbacteria bacterium]